MMKKKGKEMEIRKYKVTSLPKKLQLREDGLVPIFGLCTTTFLKIPGIHSTLGAFIPYHIYIISSLNQKGLNHLKNNRAITIPLSEAKFWDSLLRSIWWVH